MKKLILDTPFRDSFSDFLEKGETIIWRGTPRLNISYFNYILKKPLEQIPIFLLVTLFLTVFFLDFFGPLGGIIINFIFIIIQHFWVEFNNRKKKRTHYAITQKRIFFSFKILTKTNIHTIYFSELLNFQVNQDKFDRKENTFFLAVNNSKSIAFTTYNFKNGEQRHQPTLELIEDAKTVSKLLRNGIKNTKV